MVLGDNKVMARPEDQPLSTDELRQAEPRRPLRVFEINLLRDRIIDVEGELAAAEKLVVQKKAEANDLHQQWRDAGLLGR